jgi:hypothetical protein
VVDEGAGWRLVKVAASYRAFTDEAANGGSARDLGSKPDPRALLAAAGVPVDLVAVDMPLSRYQSSDGERPTILFRHSMAVGRPEHIRRARFDQAGLAMN